MSKRTTSTIFHYRNPNAPSPNTEPVIGCVTIIKNNNKVLLEKRSDSNRWAFIGGRIEHGESAEDCAKREAYEETGLRLKEIQFLCVLSDPSRLIEYPDGKVKRIITILYEIEIQNTDELIFSNESESLEFIPINELKDLNIAETHLPIRKLILDSRDDSINY